MPSSHYMPIAVAAMVGGAMLMVASDEALAPAGHENASCLPEEVSAVKVAQGAPANPQLVHYLSRRYLIAREATERMVAAAYRAAADVGLDPLLLLAVISVESRFNPIAESVMGAKGLMQIIPKYHRDKLDLLGGEDAVFDPEANILVGAQILQEYVYRTGTLEAGLQFYNGAFSDATAQYAQRVLAERARLESVLRATTLARG